MLSLTACSASHSPGTDVDATAHSRDGSHRDAAAPRDTEAAPDRDGFPPPADLCELTCSVTPRASGYDDAGFPAPTDRLEILQSLVSSSGSLHVLIAAATSGGGETARQWILASAEPGSTSFAVSGERMWPATAGSLERAGHGLNAAILREYAGSVDALVMFTVRDAVGISAMDVRMGWIAWSSDGRLHAGMELGTILTLPQPTYAHGTMFELPGSDAIAAVENAGRLEAVRLSRDHEADSPEIVERLVLGESGVGGESMAPVSGLALSEERWWLVGGGRSGGDVRMPFAQLVVAGTSMWSHPLSGTEADPPPRLASSSGRPLALEWKQSRIDVDDAYLVATRLSELGDGGGFQIPTPRLPLPRDVHTGSLGPGGFAVWSVRAPDELSDTIVYLEWIDASDGCEATEPVAIARLRGGAGAPSIHAAAAGDDLVLLGFQQGDDGVHLLTALDVRCTLGH